MRIARACLAFVHVNWHCQRSAATARRNSLFGHTFTYKQSTALVVRYFGPWAFGCVCVTKRHVSNEMDRCTFFLSSDLMHNRHGNNNKYPVGGSYIRSNGNCPVKFVTWAHVTGRMVKNRVDEAKIISGIERVRDNDTCTDGFFLLRPFAALRYSKKQYNRIYCENNFELMSRHNTYHTMYVCTKSPPNAQTHTHIHGVHGTPEIVGRFNSIQ